MAVETGEECVAKILRVIQVNSDFEKLLEEVGNTIATLPDISEGWSRDLAAMIEEQSEAIGQMPHTLATHLLVKKIKNKFTNMDLLLALTSNINDALYLDYGYLLDSIYQSIEAFPFHYIMGLHQIKIIRVQDIINKFVLSYREAEIKEYFISGLFELSCTSYSNLLKSFTEILRTENKRNNVYREILISTIKKSYSTDGCTSEKFYSILDAINDTQSLSSETIATNILRPLLTTPSLSYRHIISNQEQFMYKHLSTGLCHLYIKISQLLGIENCWKEIMDISSHDLVNREWILRFVSFAVHHHKDQLQNFKSLLYEQIGTALQDTDQTKLISILLIARQACHEGGHMFSSYSDWFKNVFGNTPQTVIHGKKHLTFLLKCLTDIIPHEPVHCLRVHLRCPPYKLPNSHDSIADYQDLLKIELVKRNEPVNVVDKDKYGSTHELSLAESDVKECLLQFEMSNCSSIPSKLLEITIFRNPYYVGRLLRVLLAPRHIPSPADVREKLIFLLKEKGKIPAGMYSNYVRECQQFKSLEDSPTFDDLSATIMYEPLVKDLQKLLRCCNDSQSQLESIFSHISSTIYAIITQSSKSVHQNYIGDLTKPGLESWEIKIVDLTLSCVFECIVKLTQQVIAKSDDSIVSNKMFTLVSIYIRMIASHEEIHWPLLVRLWELLHMQSSKLTHTQLYCISVFCSELLIAQCPLTSIHISHPPCCCRGNGGRGGWYLQNSSDYSLFLLNSLMLHCGSDFIISSKVYTNFVTHLITSGELDLLKATDSCSIKSILNKISFIYKRLNFSNENRILSKDLSDAYHMLSALHDISELNDITHIHFSITEQLTLEFTIDIHSDFLNPLQRQTFREALLVSLNYEKRFQLVFNSLTSIRHSMDNLTYCTLTHSDLLKSIDTYSWIEGKQLIMELMNGVDTVSDSSCLPLLLNVMQELLKSTADNEIEAVTSICVNVMLSLPSIFIFSNNSASPTKSLSAIHKISEFIQIYILPMCCVNNILPLQISSHLLKGVMYLESNLMSLFIRNVVLMLTSIVYHWSDFKSIYTDLNTRISDFENIEQFSKWMDSGYTLTSLQFRSWFDDNVQACSINLFFNLISSSASVSTDIDKIFNQMKLSQTNHDTLLYIVFYCCVYQLLDHLSTCLTENTVDATSAKLFDLALCCLKHNTNVWIVCKNNEDDKLADDFRMHPFNKLGNKSKLTPFLFMRLLMLLNDNKLLRKISCNESMLGFVIETHSRLFSQTDMSFSNQSFSPYYLRKSTAVMKSLINVAPVTLLKKYRSQCDDCLVVTIESVLSGKRTF